MPPEPQIWGRPRNFIEIANRHYRERAESDPNVALLVVCPEERVAPSDLMSEHGGLEIIHEEDSRSMNRQVQAVWSKDLPLNPSAASGTNS